MHRGTALVFMGALTVGVIASCSSDSELFSDQPTVTNTSASGSGGTGGSSVATTGAGGMEDECEVCTEQRCRNFHNGCYDNGACVDLIDCLDSCGDNDAVCRQDCNIDNENGIAALLLLQHCQSTICFDDCGVDNELDPCLLCTVEQCEDEVNNCLSDPECLALSECNAQCMPNDPGCAANCSNMHPNGVDPLRDLGMCQQQMCLGNCS